LRIRSNGVGRIRGHAKSVPAVNPSALYAENSPIDRILPFDAIPRVIAAAEWQQIETGIIQRITALNLLLDDLLRTALSGRSAIWIENPALRRPALKRTGPETRCPHQSGPWLDSTSA